MYPPNQDYVQALLSFPAPTLPSVGLSYAPLAGGWWRVHWLFLTNDAPSHTDAHMHTHAQMHSCGTDRLLVCCFGPSGCPSLGLDPTPSISRHVSQFSAQLVSDNDPPSSADRRSPESGSTIIEILLQYV